MGDLRSYLADFVNILRLLGWIVIIVCSDKVTISTASTVIIARKVVC